MLIDLIRNFSAQAFIDFLMFIIVFLLAITVHEVSHGYAAYRMGDYTAQAMGRLTINPVKHLDPIGTFMILIAGFGWAKPVMINPRNFRNPKKGMALSALAGPVSNILMAFVGLIILGLLNYIGDSNGMVYIDVRQSIFYIGNASGANFMVMALQFFYTFVSVNAMLAVFNCLPLPPLDGSRIMTYFLPPKLAYYYNYIERYGFIILLVLLRFAGLGTLIWFLASSIINAIAFVLGLAPFLLF